MRLESLEEVLDVPKEIDEGVLTCFKILGCLLQTWV